MKRTTITERDADLVAAHLERELLRLRHKTFVRPGLEEAVRSVASALLTVDVIEVERLSEDDHDHHEEEVK